METKNHQVIGTALILIFIGWILIDIFYPKSAPSPVEQKDPDLIAHLNADFAACQSVGGVYLQKVDLLAPTSTPTSRDEFECLYQVTGK